MWARARLFVICKLKSNIETLTFVFMLLGLFPSQGPGVFYEEFRGFQTGQTTTSVRPRLRAALIYQWEILYPTLRKDQRSTSKIKFIRSKKYTDVSVFSVHFVRKPLADGTDFKLRLEIFLPV